MERALSRACLLSRARLTGVLVERQLRGLLETMSWYQILFTLLFNFQSPNSNRADIRSDNMLCDTRPPNFYHVVTIKNDHKISVNIANFIFKNKDDVQATFGLAII